MKKKKNVLFAKFNSSFNRLKLAIRRYVWAFMNWQLVKGLNLTDGGKQKTWLRVNKCRFVLLNAKAVADKQFFKI